MRVHGDKILRRRDDVVNFRPYKTYRSILKEDFCSLCGYCGENLRVMHEKFHIDHFVPQSIDAERKNDYYNLVLACPKCNQLKSDKWPTGDKDCSHDGKIGFVDPASDEFDLHMARNEDGYVVGLTSVGQSMCQMLHLDMRRTDLYWKIDRLRDTLKKMEWLQEQGLLSEEQKDVYIEMNKLMNQYFDEAFSLGE